MTPVPTDSDFDDMHHALGRPDGPHVKPYRNFYSCDADGPTAARFQALGLWERGRDISGGLAAYRVTAEGQRLLMAWLVARQRAAGLRPWTVHGDGITARTIVAKSRSAARYDVYREISDTYDMTFREFVGLGVQVRAG